MRQGELYHGEGFFKVFSQCTGKMKRGENIVANAIYGYRKNTAGTWEPDENAAVVVRKIYEMALRGLSLSKIRDNLFEYGYPTPGEYLDLKRGKEISPKCLWATRNIRHILTNAQYIGTYIAGKERRDVIGSKKVTKPDKSEWIMIPDRHPPIISKYAFEHIQELLSGKCSGTG